MPLIIGVDGLIGRAFWNFFRSSIPNSFGTSRKNTDGLPSLDLQAPDISSLKLNFDHFTHAIIAGAIPSIKQCELEPVATSACNVNGSLELARQFVNVGIQPILFSTDYVFDGVRGGYAEIDCPKPLNQYGFQKSELEKKLSSSCPDQYLLIRLTKVIPKSTNSGLIGEISEKLMKKEAIRAAVDQIFSPVFLDDVIYGVIRLMELGANGLYNLGGSETWSRFDLANEIAKCLGVDRDLIRPISLDDLQEPFKRPKNTTLNCSKFEQATGLKPKNLRDSLKALNRARVECL